MYEISRLVLPSSNFIEYSKLFVRKDIKECFMHGQLANVNIYKFNTWMNLLAAKKYYFYCDLGDIYLKLNIDGNYKLQVIGSNRNAAFDRIDNILIDIDCINDCCIKIPNAQNYEGIYYTIIEDIKKPIKLKSGAWCTDKSPQRENKLAIISCTYKREDYIYKNIEIFENYIKENPTLKEKIKFFIVDNGKTLDTTKNNSNVKIIPNMNAGGAGGFTRGLIDIIENNQSFTRVLFMDDDVEIFPESFYRTLIFSNYLKVSFKDSFINGAMLDLYKRSVFFENLAIQKDLWVEAYHGTQELKYNNILTINDIPAEVFENENRKVDSAWWFHCFDISTVEKNGLPCPFFFRGDDVEWGWRNFGKHHISLNGICVWHSPFMYRVSKVADYYYLPRNMFFLNSLYTKDFKKTHKKLLEKILVRLLKTYDYNSLEIFIHALKDILKGSSVFEENPEKQFVNVNTIAQKTQWVECKNWTELTHIKAIDMNRKKRKNFIINIIRNCFKLMKKQSFALDWYPPVHRFKHVREVKVYNLLFHKYEIRKFDSKKIKHYSKEGYKLINKISKDYDKLHDDFVNAHNEFTKLEFWKKYLDMA